MNDEITSGRASAPANSKSQLAWRDSDSESYGDAIIELLRAIDTVPIIMLLDEMNRDAIALFSSKENDALEQLRTMLNRFTCIGVAALRFDRASLFNSWVRTASSIYMSGFNEDGGKRNFNSPQQQVTPQQLWLEVGQRVVAVGGYAVRRENWGAVRQLSLQVTTDRHSTSSGVSQYWLRHVIKEAANAGILNTSNAREKQNGDLISHALWLVENEPCLCTDLPPDDHRLLQSLLGFDLLAVLVVSTDAGEFSNSYAYPSFIYWDIYRVEPMLVRLLRSEEMRDELFVRKIENGFIAQVLRRISEVANRRSHGWSQWSGRAVTKFLSDYPEANSNV